VDPKDPTKVDKDCTISGTGGGGRCTGTVVCCVVIKPSPPAPIQPVNGQCKIINTFPNQG
jgi:hypothetical protein